MHKLHHESLKQKQKAKAYGKQRKHISNTQTIDQRCVEGSAQRKKRSAKENMKKKHQPICPLSSDFSSAPKCGDGGLRWRRLIWWDIKATTNLWCRRPPSSDAIWCSPSFRRNYYYRFIISKHSSVLPAVPCERLATRWPKPRRSWHGGVNASSSGDGTCAECLCTGLRGKQHQSISKLHVDHRWFNRVTESPIKLLGTPRYLETFAGFTWGKVAWEIL